MAVNGPTLSVVMATYNRAETLRTTLRHLADQTLPSRDYEVIVVDDESPDHTRAVVAEWTAAAPFKVTYLHHANRGPGYTQNRGLDVAEGRIVLFMADDIFMAPGALQAHVDMHAANPEPAVAVLGRVEQDEIRDQGLFLRTWDAFGFRAFAGQTELPYYRFWACNVSAKRDFVRRYGPYREHRGRAGYAAHEDVELGFRLSLGGLRLLYNPAALGIHHHVVTFAAACRRRYMQGLNFGEFRALMGVPETSVVYHVLGFRTLGDHLRTWFGPRGRFLSPGDRNPIRLLARHLVGAAVFNRWTVRHAWEPFLAAAETASQDALRNTAGRTVGLARFVNATMYRGVIFHYFIMGCREGDRMEAQARAVKPSLR